MIGCWYNKWNGTASDSSAPSSKNTPAKRSWGKKRTSSCVDWNIRKEFPFWHTRMEICNLRERTVLIIKHKRRFISTVRPTVIYLNCGDRYEDMIDHHSYTHNLSSCEIKAWKKFRPERDSNPWPLRVYYELTKWPAPRWLDSSVGRALHRYHRGHWFQSRSGLHFCRALI